jgi:ABC-type dipeptide/oligopeptide/nickel transport system permease component
MAIRAAKKLLEFLLTLFMASSAVFFMSRLAPSDPVEILLGENATYSDRVNLRKELKLDVPLLNQYGHFIASIATADPGNSLVTRRPVADEIKEAFPFTCKLGMLALLLALSLGLPAGYFAAFREGEAFDKCYGIASSIMVVSPSFLTGPILLLILAVEFPIFPVSGDGSFQSYLLPAAALSIPVAAYLSRILRVSLVEESGKPYLITANEKGLSRRNSFFVHLLPNALLPVIQVSGLEFGALLTGAIITEKIFRIPGLGSLLAKSVFSRDYTLLTSLIILFSLVYLVGNLLADAVSSFVDPRLRHEA